MFARILLASLALVSLVADGYGQLRGTGNPRATTEAPSWRPAGEAVGPTAPAPTAGTAAAPASAPAGTPTAAGIRTATLPGRTPAAPAEAPRRPFAKVTNGNGSLPNEAGQVWREYDISPYTARVTTTQRPEQAIIDSILRETGYEAWHGEPLGILSASRKTLRVYHTPEMQNTVGELVDRFVSSEAETATFGLRVLTLDSPSWRSKAQRMLRPITVQTQGVSAWLLEKEDALALLADLQRRTDYREHSSPHLLVNNGQATVVSTVRPRQYAREVVLRPDVAAGHQAVLGQVEEGFLFDFSPLLSIDQKTIDATIRCDINQVEKLVPVVIEVPTPTAPRQRTKLDVPQMTHFRFQERFRWPTDKVLLLGLGMVAMPAPTDGKATVPGLPILGTAPARADLLVFVDCKGTGREAPRVTRQPDREAKTYRGRY
jgi:hypothetical protein